MPRISGVDLPANKKVFVALTYIYGIGDTIVQDILDEAKVDGNKRVSDLTPDEVNRIQKIIDAKYDVEGTLRQDIRESIERLKRIDSYRGDRHRRNLPARGQRTRTNARTRRGKRRTVGAMSKELAQKMEEAKRKA